MPAKKAKLHLAKKKDTDFHFYIYTEIKVPLSSFRQMDSRLWDFMHYTRLKRLKSLGARGRWGELCHKNYGDGGGLA